MTALVAYLRDREVGRWALTQAMTTVGRAESNQVSIDNLAFSRRHARIESVERGFLLRDLDSQNGTFVNGKRLEQPRLFSVGDVMRVGKLTFRLVPDGGDPPPTVAETERDLLVLQVQHPQHDVRRFALVGDEIVLGRADQADVQLAGQGISRRHATLARHGEHFVLTDLGSQNGTWVNEVRIQEPTTVKPGDHMHIYGYTLSIEKQAVRMAEAPVDDDDPFTAQPTVLLAEREIVGGLRKDALPAAAFGFDPSEPPTDFEEPTSAMRPGQKGPRQVSMADAPVDLSLEALRPVGDAVARIELFRGDEVVVAAELENVVTTVGDTSACDVLLEPGDLTMGEAYLLIQAAGDTLVVVQRAGPAIRAAIGSASHAVLTSGDEAELGRLRLVYHCD